MKILGIETSCDETAVAIIDGKAPPEKRIKANDKDAKLRLEVLQKLLECLNDGHRARNAKLEQDEWKRVKDLQLITTKPVMYIANVAEDGFEDNPYLDVVREKALGEDAEVVPVCAGVEAEISQLDEADPEGQPDRSAIAQRHPGRQSDEQGERQHDSAQRRAT